MARMTACQTMKLVFYWEAFRTSFRFDAEICKIESGCHYFKLNASILQAQKDIGHFAKAIWVII